MTRVDVAIVGAGPAGSTLAALLAQRGVSVALLDRDLFPRDKLCGEFLSYDALPVLERLEIGFQGASTIRRCVIHAAGRNYAFDFPDAARGISRLALDHALFQKAVGLGATGIEGANVSEISANHVGAGDVRIEARAVVGAWGRWGRFDVQLGRTFTEERRHRNFGFKRHYRPKNGATGSEAIALYSFAGGYLGVNEVEDGVINVCGLVRGERLSGHRGKWSAFVDRIAAERSELAALFDGLVPAQDSFLSSDPVIFRPRQPVEHGIFMIGDSSGVIDPLTGNGMAMAIQSALLLAPSIIRLLACPDQRTSIESEYAAAHGAMFRRRLQWSRAVASLLTRPRLLRVALGLSRSPGAGRAILRATRVERSEIERRADAWFSSSRDRFRAGTA